MRRRKERKSSLSSQIKRCTTRRKTYVEGRDDAMAATLNPALLPVGVDGLRKSN